jgi:hypothetical protein
MRELWRPYADGVCGWSTVRRDALEAPHRADDGTSILGTGDGGSDDAEVVAEKTLGQTEPGP